MKYCVSCGAQLAEGVAFCTACGTPVAQQPAQQPAAQQPPVQQAPVNQPPIQQPPIQQPPVQQPPYQPQYQQAPYQTQYQPPQYAPAPQQSAVQQPAPKKKSSAGLIIIIILLAIALVVCLVLLISGGKDNAEPASGADKPGLFSGILGNLGIGGEDEPDVTGEPDGTSALTPSDAPTVTDAGASAPEASDNGSAPASSGSVPSEWLSLPSGSYAALLQSGNYYMKYTANMMGIDMDCEIASRGADSESKANVWGMITHTVTVDGIKYELDEANKQYTQSDYDPEAAAAEAVSSGVFSYNNMTYKGSFKGAIPDYTADTAEYDYDEFAISIDYYGTPTDMPVRMYIKDGELYAMYIEAMGIPMIMVIDELSTDIPAGMIEVPDLSGWTKVDSLY